MKPNHALQLTTGRHDGEIDFMKHVSMFRGLAAASGR
jgi:hypothetical protein